MRQIVIAAVLTLIAAVPSSAVDFLGVELCTERVDTGAILPADSPLSLESVEVGRHGGLVLLLHSKNANVLDQVDDLMVSYTGSRGTGDEQRLEWTGNQITAFAQVIKKGYVALAVTASKDCTAEPARAPAPAPVPVAIETEAAPKTEETEDTFAAEATAAAAEAVSAVEVESGVDSPDVVEDFKLEGRLKHAMAEDGWVDIMGVVANNSGASYTVASFDISLYDGAGDLICVDTVSVNQLREGQERAFRGAIRCTDYVADEVASWKLQFSGGH
jgi:hypothetical protein